MHSDARDSAWRYWNMREGLHYRDNTASAPQIVRHLAACDAAYVPTLSSRVALPEYATKLASHAMRVEAWEADNLAGLAAFYCNRPPLAFLSNLSVLPDYRRRGIAAYLLKQCMIRAAREGCASLWLTLGQGNGPALTLYRQHGFVITEENDGIITMTCSV